MPNKKMSIEKVIRQAKPDDAHELNGLFSALYWESDYLLLESGEFNLSVEEQVKLIEQHSGSTSWVLFVAEEKGKLVGFLGDAGGKVNRNRHAIEIATGVRERNQGNGNQRQSLISVSKHGV